MPNSLESALLIDLSGTLPWSAALSPLNPLTGTLTAVDPGQTLDVTKYARRDREFQHRDMVAGAAVAKVSVFARTVWGGTVVQPVLQGITNVTDITGTNVVMPLDPAQVGNVLPNSSTGVTYVQNSGVPYTTVQVTDVSLYNRDLLLYETLARAASIFTPDPPINLVDPANTYIGSTSVWATAQGTNRPKVPNAANPMSLDSFRDPDFYLAERDNRVAAYVSRVAQALQNPFEYATRIYVQVIASSGGNSEESETYVLTDNVFISGNTYTAGEQVLYKGTWYQAINTTTDIPPSSNWSVLTAPTQLQFLAEPSLDSRNRVVYDRVAKTLQWFRETLDLIHVPQIVGFYIPGILPNQTIQTVPAVPERKDAQFYRQKAARVQFSTGTYSNQFLFAPTGNRDSLFNRVTGGLNAVLYGQKNVTLPVPASFTVDFKNRFCSAGTYALDLLVRPLPSMSIAGGDNDQGSVDSTDGGTTYSAIGDTRNWEVALPAGGWKLFIEFANFSPTATSFFGIKASQGATSILSNTLPIYYTDQNGDPLPQGMTVSSQGIDIQSTGQNYNFSLTWTAGSGLLHISRLRFEQVNGPDTSHYIMAAAWLNSGGSATTEIVGGSEASGGGIPTVDGGVDYPSPNTTLTWNVQLIPGSWQLFIDYANSSASSATKFDILVTLPGLSNQPFSLPYTDSGNNPLAQNTLRTSSAIGIPSNGTPFNIGIKWTSSAGVFHIKDLTFVLNSTKNTSSSLDVIGQANQPDVMPFQFYLSGSDSAPSFTVTWLPKSASIWQAKPYNVGDQVLLNLVYWQATTATTASEVPGVSPKWTQLGQEPQIPLMVEAIQLSKLLAVTPTPETIGFQGFRQDMLERALRANQDAYTQALITVGTNFPEFRDSNQSWNFASTGSWMGFLEVYAPRLRQVNSIPSGNIVPGHQYEAITQGNDAVVYNTVTYSNGQKFTGVTGVATYTPVGSPIVNQVGAYRASRPHDLGKTGLVPAGIEYFRLAGTGTVHGWYPSYASYPTHQAVQPWMIEQGFYVAQNDFDSPDGNFVPTGSNDNPPETGAGVKFDLGLTLNGPANGITDLTITVSHSIAGFDVENDPELITLSFPFLIDIDPANTQQGFFFVSGNNNLTALTAPLLTTVGGGFSFDGNSLVTINFSALTTVGGALQIGPGAESVSLPSLTSVGGDFFSNSWAGVTLNLPSLVSIAGVFAPNFNLSLTTVNVPKFVPFNGQQISFINCNLNAASINQILAHCVANAAYVTGLVALDAGTNAAPTGQGVADKATLIGRGVTVQTN